MRQGRENHDLLTMKEAAERLKVSPATIKRYLKQDRLRAYHLGPRAIRVKREDVERLLVPHRGVGIQPEREQSAEYEQPTPVLPTLGEEELARRQAAVQRILAGRDKRRIAPLTASELVRLAREEKTWYGNGH